MFNKPPKRVRPAASWERSFLPLYPYAAALGALCGISTLLWSDGWTKLIVLVWVIAIPLWLSRWWDYRQGRL